MTAYRFKAQALTPIHVGSGVEIDPTQFIIRDGRLVHFNPTQVLNDVAREESDRFLRLLEAADLRGMQSFLRSHVDLDRHGLARVDASAAFCREFEIKAANPNNRFRVDMMPRNPHSGGVYLPGSSIKGAIRTAVVNHFANLDPSTRPEVHAAVHNAPSGGKARALEDQSLNRGRNQTERDIFRLVDIEDISLPEASTRIDRVANLNPRKQGAEKIQIWTERIKAHSDDISRAPGFPITLHLDSLAMQHRAVQSLLGRRLDIETILTACNSFYWKRLQAEGDKFDGRSSNGASWKALCDLFPKGKTQDGKIVAIEPSKPYWCSPQRKRMLLRVGRYCHFESLSVDDLRRGYNVQARRPIPDMGATRTRCLMEGGKPPMPFGWLLLTLENS